MITGYMTPGTWYVTVGDNSRRGEVLGSNVDDMDIRGQPVILFRKGLWSPNKLNLRDPVLYKLCS